MVAGMAEGVMAMETVAGKVEEGMEEEMAAVWVG
jgi:hypothetical protein